MTNRTESTGRTILRIRITTIISIVLIIIAVVFAWLGFGKAGDLRVAAALVSLYLFLSGLALAAQFVIGIRQPERWQRILAIIAVLAAVFMLVMAVVMYQGLNQIQVPSP